MEFTLPYDSSLRINKLEKLLDETVASYKLFWLDGIQKEVIRGNCEITFRKIVIRMIATAWYPLVEYKLSFGRFDSLDNIVDKINKKYKIEKNKKEEDLLKFLENLKDDEIEKEIEKIYNMVPYRLLTPFFERELRGVKDSRKNKMIVEFSNRDEGALYKIDISDPKEKKIIVNPLWKEYIEKNQSILYGWIRYKLIVFLQKRNPNVPAIAFKLEPPLTRKLNKPTKWWTLFNKEVPIRDIYTGELLCEENFKKYGTLSIDHFIPWSFVLHDEFWNLIPTFKNVNSSKSDNLPDLNKYFDAFCNLQFDSFNRMLKNEKCKNMLEEYSSMNLTMEFNSKSKLFEPISKGEFVTSMKNTIKPLYQIAYNQGFEIWEYSSIKHKSIEGVDVIERI